MESSCSICLENITDKSMTMPECSHIFHSSCMMKYIESNIPNEIKCPICRRSVIKSCSLEVQVPIPIVMSSLVNQDTNDHEQYINLYHCRMICLTTSIILCMWLYMIYENIQN